MKRVCVRAWLLTKLIHEAKQCVVLNEQDVDSVIDDVFQVASHAVCFS